MRAMYEWLGFADDDDDDDVDEGDVDGDGWTMPPKMSEMSLSRVNSVSMLDSEPLGLMLPDWLVTDEVDSLEETEL